MALTVEIDIELRRVRAEVRSLLNELEQGLSRGFDLDSAGAGRELRNLALEAQRTDRALEGVTSNTVKVRADGSELEDVVAVADRLDSKTATVKIGADDSEVDAASRKVDGLDGLTVKVGVDVEEPDTDGFAANLGSQLKSRIAALGVGAVIQNTIQESLARADFQAVLNRQLGDGAEVAGRAAGELFASGVSSSIGDAFSATGQVARAASQFGDITEAQLERITAAGINVERVWGEDVGATVQAAAQLVRNNAAPDFESAFQIIVSGFDGGLNRANDFLDTINEYAPQFDRLGISGQQSLALVSQGLDAGAFNADKVADAFKELSIRVIDDSESTRAALAALDLSGIERDFAAGGESASAATQQILDGLQSIQDPQDRMNIAVGLFGTQIEDLGPKVLEAFDLTDDSFEDAAVSLEDFNADLETSNTRLQSLINTVRSDLVDVASGIEGAFNAESVDDFAESLSFLDNSPGEGLRDGLQDLGNFIGGLDFSLSDDGVLSITEQRDQVTLLTSDYENAFLARGAAFERQQAQAIDAANALETLRDLNTFDVDTAPAIDALNQLRRTDVRVNAQLELDRAAADAEFAAAATEISALVESVFGDPLAPAFDPEVQISIDDWLAQVLILQEAVTEGLENLEFIEASDVFSPAEEDALFDIFDNAGEEAGAVLAAQVAEQIKDGDYSGIKSQLEQVVAQAALGRILEAQIASADTGITATVNLEDSEIRALAQQTFGIAVNANVDSGQLTTLLSEEYGVTVVANVDDTELNNQEATTRRVPTTLDVDDSGLNGLTAVVATTLDSSSLQAQLNAISLSVGVTPTGGLAEGGAFSPSGVQFMRNGGSVLRPGESRVAYRPGLGEPFQYGGRHFRYGEDRRGPEFAAATDQGMAVVGPYHRSRLSFDRLDSIGMVDQMMPHFLDKARQMGRIQYASLSPSPVVVQSGDPTLVAGLREEIAGLRSEVRTLTGHAASTADSTGATAMNTRPLLAKQRRGRPLSEVTGRVAR